MCGWLCVYLCVCLCLCVSVRVCVVVVVVVVVAVCAEASHPIVATIRRAVTTLVDRTHIAETKVSANARAAAQLEEAQTTVTALQDLVAFLEDRVHTLQVGDCVRAAA